jgi:hypothetical protein
MARLGAGVLGEIEEILAELATEPLECPKIRRYRN